MKTTVLSIALLPLALTFAGCSHEKTAVSAAPETVRGVQTITVQRASLLAYYDAVGTVRSVQTAQLASQATGVVVRVNAREGDRVRRGQVLAVIDDSQTRAGLNRASAALGSTQQDIAVAEAELTLAASTLKRYQGLYESKSVSPHEFDEIKTRYEAAKARREAALAGRTQADAAVAQARTMQGFTQIRAPFDGVVTAKLTETGNLASPGTPIFVVEDSSRFRLEANVDERAVSTVRLGQTVPVILDAVGEDSLAGKVVQILPAVDPASHTFLIKIELPRDQRIRSGLFGRARFPLGNRESLAAPQTAVVQRGTMQAVYVVGADQVASLRYVSLGRADANGVEVLSGLQSGERIVAKPGSDELNGKKIEVR
ncbi:MAG TPA: efflux RND transporter periplasmic adaptor subunit [Clostridia bacterium]|nr:efflux RND transporter periplasmic adaptor subunit [Clostridia bacterium]